MGRSNCRFSIPLPWLLAKPEHRDRVLSILGDEITASDIDNAMAGKVTWNHEVTRSTTGAWFEIQIEDERGGGYERSLALANAHIPFLHGWDAGGEYTEGAGACTGRRHMDVSTIGESPAVTIDEHGRPSASGMRDVRAYRAIARVVRRMAMRPVAAAAA